MKGHIFLIIGPSGAGKNTLIRLLFEKYPELTFIPSFTTRQMRPGEYDGNPYHFISQDEFNQKINNNEFYEYQNVHGNLYGTSQKEFQRIIDRGQIGITDVDILGALKIKQSQPDSITTIFIRPSDTKTLLERLKGRNTESIQDIEQRLQRITLELEKENQCDITTINDNLDEAINSLLGIIKNYMVG